MCSSSHRCSRLNPHKEPKAVDFGGNCGLWEQEQGGHLLCQNETEPKLADYSEAQICSQIPGTELGHSVQQPGSGPGPDAYSPVL